MARQPTKAAGNVYCQARMEAAKYDERLKSREGAAELLGMSVSSLADAELGLNKVMPVDKMILMADLYKAPWLQNYYCKHECPNGTCRPISEEVNDIEAVTVKLCKRLRSKDLETIKDKLVDIAEDGVIQDCERSELDDIVKCLDDLSKVISELKTVSQMVLCGEEYEK